MKHLFSSGEVMYKKNQKELPEGLFVGEFLEYDRVEADTQFVCFGKLNDRQARVVFAISDDDFEGVKSRHAFRILMQSDIFLAEWKNYEIVLS